MKVRVLKKMISLGKTLQPGDIVDASGWRHVKALISNRYIELASDASAPKPAKVEAPKVEIKVEDEAPKKVSKKDKDKE